MRNAYGPFWCLAMLPNKMTCFLAHMQTSRKIVHGPYAILEIRGNTFEENSFYGCPLSMDALHKSSLIILWPSLLLPSSPMSITGLVGISVGTSNKARNERKWRTLSMSTWVLGG